VTLPSGVTDGPSTAGEVITSRETLIERARALTGTRRSLIGIAGPPGSGKSTLAERLVARLDAAVVVPMDGFHLDDTLLVPAGLRAVKGAPQTFDVAGLDTLLQRIAADDGAVHIPVFDRAMELSRAAAATVSPEHRCIVVEGNWLLLDEPHWRALADRFDLTVLVEVDEVELEQRLMRRWRQHGLDEAAARQKVQGNDLPNGRRVMNGSVRVDVRFRNAMASAVP